MISPLRGLLVVRSCLSSVGFLSAISAAQSCCPSTNSSVATWHNGIYRIGWQCNQGPLKQSNVTAAGNGFGLLQQWTVTASVYAQPLAVTHAVLHAFCATNAGGRCTTALAELYNSAQNVSRHYISGDVSFSTPTIFNGRVYIGTLTPNGQTTSEIDVFGLCSNNAPSGCLN